MPNPNIEIIMGFDFGTKKIGIAIGQKLTYTTQPIAVLRSKNGIPNWKNIESIYNIWQPSILVVGLPLQTDGTEQPITILAKNFAIQLRNKFGITVEMHDERFSTIEARYFLYNNIQFNFNKKIHKHIKHIVKKIDSLSAEIILTSWLQQ